MKETKLENGFVPLRKGVLDHLATIDAAVWKVFTAYLLLPKIKEEKEKESLYMAAYSNITVDQICEKIGVCNRTVLRARDKLCEIGFLEKMSSRTYKIPKFKKLKDDSAGESDMSSLFPSKSDIMSQLAENSTRQESDIMSQSKVTSCHQKSDTMSLTEERVLERSTIPPPPQVINTGVCTRAMQGTCHSEEEEDEISKKEEEKSVTIDQDVRILQGLILGKYRGQIIEEPPYSACRNALEDFRLDELREALDRCPVALKNPNPTSALNCVYRYAENKKFDAMKGKTTLHQQLDEAKRRLESFKNDPNFRADAEYEIGMVKEMESRIKELEEEIKWEQQQKR